MSDYEYNIEDIVDFKMKSNASLKEYTKDDISYPMKIFKNGETDNYIEFSIHKTAKRKLKKSTYDMEIELKNGDKFSVVDAENLFGGLEYPDDTEIQFLFNDAWLASSPAKTRRPSSARTTALD